jgi:hypothetical protein
VRTPHGSATSSTEHIVKRQPDTARVQPADHLASSVNTLSLKLREAMRNAIRMLHVQRKQMNLVRPFVRTQLAPRHNADTQTLSRETRLLHPIHGIVVSERNSSQARGPCRFNHLCRWQCTIGRRGV